MKKITVHIRDGAGRIDQVCADVVRYTDDSGNQREIRFEPVLDRYEHYVGFRKLDEPPWTVRMRGGDVVVEFHFESYDAAYQILLIPLDRVGFATLDLT